MQWWYGIDCCSYSIDDVVKFKSIFQIIDWALIIQKGFGNEFSFEFPHCMALCPIYLEVLALPIL